MHVVDLVWNVAFVTLLFECLHRYIVNLCYVVTLKMIFSFFVPLSLSVFLSSFCHRPPTLHTLLVVVYIIRVKPLTARNP